MHGDTIPDHVGLIVGQPIVGQKCPGSLSTLNFKWKWPGKALCQTQVMQDAGEVEDLGIEFQITRIADEGPKEKCSSCMVEEILGRCVSCQLCSEPRHFRIYQRDSRNGLGPLRGWFLCGLVFPLRILRRHCAPVPE